MLPELLIKKPILMIGILLMIIFAFQLHNKGYFNRDNLNPSSCRAVLVKLDRRIPGSWITKCEGNNLAVIIPFKNEKLKDIQKLKIFAYRELANNLVQIAKNSPEDNLERTDFVRILMSNPKIDINVVTEGRYIIKLATIKNKKFMAEHLKTTVHVKETIK